MACEKRSVKTHRRRAHFAHKDKSTPTRALQAQGKCSSKYWETREELEVEGGADVPRGEKWSEVVAASGQRGSPANSAPAYLRPAA